MSVEGRGVGRAASAQADVHARIERWAIVRLREPGKAATLHIVGCVIEHTRLGDDVGQPYLGSSQGNRFGAARGRQPPRPDHRSRRGEGKFAYD